MATLFETICQHLDGLGIEYKTRAHEAVTTSAEAAAVRGVDPHTGAKALLVKSKDSFAVFVVPGDRLLDWKSVKHTLSNKSVRFATAEEMLDLTGLVKGSLPPFGNLLGLPVYMDEEMPRLPLVRFNAGSLTDSVEMPGPDLPRAADAIMGVFSAE